MPGVSKITHKGKEILFIDYSGGNEQEMIQVLKDAQQAVIRDNKEYLQLADFTNCFATATFMSEAKKVGKDTPKLAKKRAIVGINSQGKRILLQAYNLVIGSSGLKPFDTLEEAKIG